MLSYHLALIADGAPVELKELTSVAAALQKQVTRDFGPIWDISADVSAFASLEDMPLDYWPVIIKDKLDDPTAGGYHEDSHGQPYSLVAYSDDWTLAASHETLEMLADPFGRRMIAGPSPKDGQGRVKFLVEVCDPCEDASCAYSVNGVVVSDFYTPHYFDPVASVGTRYSFHSKITAPRQVLKGGYLSWYDPATKTWWQRTWFGDKATDRKLSDLKITGGNPRAAIDRITQPQRAKAMTPRKGATVPGQHIMGLEVATFANQAADLRAAARRVSRRR
jgi:hypothetical protein